MNSDLTQTDSVLNTDNPQGAGSPAGASDSSDFQQAAGLETLNQNRSLEVISNGQPITNAPRPAASQTSTGAYVVIIIGTIAFLMICVRLIQWVMKDQPRETVAKSVAAVKDPALKPAVAGNKKGKKKQPRSKRRK